MLPTKLYEGLRWMISVVLPAVSVLLTTLDGAWGWGLPLEGILATISGIGLFLGTVFGISKIINDREG